MLEAVTAKRFQKEQEDTEDGEAPEDHSNEGPPMHWQEHAGQRSSKSLAIYSPVTAAKYLDDQSFQAVYQMALSQLWLGLDLIIDTSFSCRTYLDQLLQLSASTGASLVIVECKPQDKYE
ncbi:hypothetical protein Acr_20g0009490 [Actinidia rufa]|uniref:Uncharacterized protein n=1 Tax=Actinidia rufa TaxID=165716 RepID=A0A7J0GEE7_9ERIC|nr:hypothetical protein Acr_20g0009490 [Actinidia rufa]